MKQVPLKADEKDIKRWKKAAGACGISLSSYIRQAVDHAIEMQLDFAPPPPRPTYPVQLSKVPHKNPKGPEKDLAGKKYTAPGGVTMEVESLEFKESPSPKKRKPSGDTCPHRVPIGSYCKRCS